MAVDTVHRNATNSRTTRVGAPAMSELGITGYRRTSGWVDEEFIPKLRGAQGRQVYREMLDNDPVVGAGMLAIDLQLRKTLWTVTPKDGSNLAQQAADHTFQCLHDMDSSWQDNLSSFLSMLGFGWSWHEMVFKRRQGARAAEPSDYGDGKIGWARLPIRQQESLFRWDFDEPTNKILGMEQMAAPDFRVRKMPYSKSLLFRVSARTDSPESKSILRNAYVPWYRKRRIEDLEAIGVERDLAGLPIALVPPEILALNAAENEVHIRNSIADLTRNVRRNEAEGILFPKEMDQNGHDLYEFKLLSSGGRRQFNTDDIVARHDSRILMSMLDDFILLGHEGGSLGVGNTDSKIELFSAGLKAWNSQIQSEMNRRAIPLLVELNGWPREISPTLEFGEVKAVDLVKLSQLIIGLSQSGAFGAISLGVTPAMPDDIRDHVLELAELPTAGAGGTL